MLKWHAQCHVEGHTLFMRQKETRLTFGDSFEKGTWDKKEKK